jgi:hypothetical protein
MSVDSKFRSRRNIEMLLKCSKSILGAIKNLMNNEKLSKQQNFIFDENLAHHVHSHSMHFINQYAKIYGINE